MSLPRITRAIATIGVTILVGSALLVQRGVLVQAAPSQAVPRCSNIQLLIRPYGSNGAAGTIVITYRIHDLWNGVCSLYGYPGLELLDRNFQSLPTHLTRGGIIAGGIPVRYVQVSKGHDAYFALSYNDVTIDNFPCYSAPYLMITPPNDNLPVVTYSKIGAPCAGRITVAPVMPTPQLG
ncbi:MAG: DUF4232 domain-containing protein [Chloroflexota bacterium]